MAFKLLDSVSRTCITVPCKKRKCLLLKSEISCMLQMRARFCSKATEDSSESREEKIKKLLNEGSPLKISEKLDIDNHEWATSAYPAGTVFRKDLDKPKSENLEQKTVILFPGQGNQFVGMAKNLRKYPVALDMFNAAGEILKYNLLKVCLEGPEHKLNETKCCQAATFVCSLALLEKVKDEKPWVISNCRTVCGYSLGELTALVFAGCLNFEKGLKLVKIRAEAMSDCCKKSPGGMLTIFTGPFTKLTEALTDAVEHCKSIGIENPQCSVGSYLFTNCKVISGNTEALDFLANNAAKYGIRRHSKLPVSGAFHTKLMKDAADVLQEELKKTEIKDPLVRVFSNVTGKPYHNSKQIKSLLPKQIYLPVKWEQTVQNMFSHRSGAPLPLVYEVGPGSSLATTVHKINHNASPTTYAIKL